MSPFLKFLPKSCFSAYIGLDQLSDGSVVRCCRFNSPFRPGPIKVNFTFTFPQQIQLCLQQRGWWFVRSLPQGGASVWPLGGLGRRRRRTTLGRRHRVYTVFCYQRNGGPLCGCTTRQVWLFICWLGVNYMLFLFNTVYPGSIDLYYNQMGLYRLGL